MKKTTFRGKQFEVPANVERCLRALSHQPVRPVGDFETGHGNHRGTDLPDGNRWGRGEGYGFYHHSRRSSDPRAVKFFADHPRHRTVIIAKLRTVRAILRAIDQIEG